MLQILYKSLGEAVTAAVGIDAKLHQKALMVRDRSRQSSTAMLRGVATLNLDDFVYEKVPELLLMRTLKVFKPFQS